VGVGWKAGSDGHISGSMHLFSFATWSFAMKKFVLSLVAAFGISPVLADEPVNLAALGLGNLQQVSEEAGMKVRGMSSSAQGFSMASVSILLIDPNTGGQASIGQSSFQWSTDENAGLGLIASSRSDTFSSVIAPDGFDLVIDNENGFSYTGLVSPFFLYSGSQGGGAADFDFDLPTFFFAIP
jgi:hypothetical protein